MKKITKKFNRIIIIPIVIILVGSLAIPVLADNNFISESLSRVGSVLHSNDHLQKIERKEEKPQSLTSDITLSLQTENPVNAIKARAIDNRKHRLHQQDEFNYVQKDVEELLLSGATLEDIYRSDEIGNQLLVNPKDLIKLKHQGNQTWDDIETDVTAQKKKQLKTLMKKHTNLESQFSKQTISDAEKLEILQHVELSQDQTSDNVITTYKEEGRSGLQKLHDKTVNGRGGK